MKTITFKGKELALKGQVELDNKTIDFKAVNQEGQEVKLTDFKSNKKVISLFPKLNTSVCDNQTMWLSSLAKANPEIDFIPITMDDEKTITKWCLAHEVDNIKILSDKKYKEFGSQTNLYIPKIDMLHRGFIVLDKDNKVVKSLFKTELTDDPDFEALEQTLNDYMPTI